MSYATLSQFKAAVGITDSADDTALQNVLDATDTLIDLHCDRKTGFGTASETRYYTPENFNYVLVDDLVSVTTLQTDDNADGTYETTWSSATDYKLAPINAALDGWPYDVIETSVTVPRSFPKNVYLGLKLVGVFGFPSVPAAVTQAAIIQANAVWSSRTAPFAVVGSQDLGGILRMTRALHPEAALILEPYRRRAGLAR
jgi:hypothetical protein